VLAEKLRGERAGIPTLVQVLGDEAGALEPGQHLVRDGPADAVVLGERAFVEKEAAIGEANRDRVLDLGVDALPAIADLQFVGEGGGETQAGVAEVEPERRCPLTGHVTAPVEIAEEAVVLELAKGDRRRHAARLKGAGDAGLADDEAGGEAAVDDMLAEHVVDERVERRPRSSRKPGCRPRHQRMMWVMPPTLILSIAAKSQAIPMPGESEGMARPFSMRILSMMRLSSCGMYSTQRPLGTAATRETCSSMRKCGDTATLNASARWATFSHGVMPPMRATSTWMTLAASRCRYSRKCCRL